MEGGGEEAGGITNLFQQKTGYVFWWIHFIHFADEYQLEMIYALFMFYVVKEESLILHIPLTQL